MHLTLCTIVVACVFFSLGAAPAPSANTSDLRLMTFNLRTSTASDGENGWDHRKEMLIRAIRAADPDLLGTQECQPGQGDYLREKLPEYTFVGVGREDGKRKGEFSAILFRTDRFELLDSGTFWLSEHPDQVGSRSWDTALERICTWAKLRDRKADKTVYYLNTHFDHKGKVARLESAKLMRRWIDEHAKGSPVLVTGDFNADAGTDPYKALMDTREGGVKLTDVYRALHPAGADESTFHGFSGKGTGIRIDWIFCSGEFEPAAAEIDHFSEKGRYPSDHFPVTATVKWK
jgi:endonuclease/exonuclease/phosphatase family metal-dependent hydrolase